MLKYSQQQNDPRNNATKKVEPLNECTPLLTATYCSPKQRYYIFKPQQATAPQPAPENKTKNPKNINDFLDSLPHLLSLCKKGCPWITSLTKVLSEWQDGKDLFSTYYAPGATPQLSQEAKTNLYTQVKDILAKSQTSSDHTWEKLRQELLAQCENLDSGTQTMQPR